ncbi:MULTISPECIES: hypothetical protein [unclassified Yoonia]|uniref:hypothetical protein n=1 Tax=unclassified Yoonia TaxID=2629118 RepID=UPI002AFF3CB6|nr:MULTISPECIES: hypothetical protein [unclassified Yoonia]
MTEKQTNFSYWEKNNIPRPDLKDIETGDICGLERDKVQEFLNDLVLLSERHGIVLSHWCAGTLIQKLDESFEGYSVYRDGDFLTDLASYSKVSAAASENNKE